MNMVVREAPKNLMTKRNTENFEWPIAISQRRILQATVFFYLYESLHLILPIKNSKKSCLDIVLNSKIVILRMDRLNL